MKSKLLSLALIIGLASCGNSQPQNNVYVQPASAQTTDINVQASDVPGFDVNNFAALLKTQKNPQALEQVINSANNNVNNLDLNGDGNIDYVKINEVGANTLQVVDNISATDSVIVATLTLTPGTKTMTIQGNQDYCGNNYYYQSTYHPTDWLFMAYLLTPHVYYHPMWHYGYYPRYYGVGYRSHYGHSYTRSSVTRVREYRTNPSSFRQKYYPSKSYSTPSSPVRRSLSTPGSSQRSFQVRSSSTPVRSGGFGNSSSRSRSSFGSPSSSSRSSFGSSRSSFGSSRSSFGGSRSSFGGGRRGR